MNKIIKFLFYFLLLFILLTPITCFAAEVAAEDEQIGYNTIFTRLWEFVEDNKTEVVSAAGSFILLVANSIIKHTNSKQNRKIGEALSLIKSDTTGTTKAQNSIIDVINQMIGRINVMINKVETMYTAYEENQAIEKERNRLLGAIMVEVTAILEMISSVYVHNSRLPQGIKDLVVLKYANAQKTLNDDELLYAIVESVRDKINFEDPVEIEDENIEKETVE